MQTTGQFHRDIGIALFGIPEHVLDDPASLDARDHMFDHNPNAGNETIMGFIVRRQLASAGFFLRLVNHYPRHLMALKARVAVYATALRGADAVFIAYLFIVLLAFVSIT